VIRANSGRPTSLIRQEGKARTVMTVRMQVKAFAHLPKPSAAVVQQSALLLRAPVPMEA
jgi:hypothetical protein